MVRPAAARRIIQMERIARVAGEQLTGTTKSTVELSVTWNRNDIRRFCDVQSGDRRRRAQEQMDEQEGIEGEAVYGRVGPALPEWSASLDLLVLGSRGYGTIGRPDQWQHVQTPRPKRPLRAARAERRLR
jgi:hypothetical protein